MKKQIDEILMVIDDNACANISEDECDSKDSCAICRAERIYNAGYRKQEWISVDERLPKEFVSVLGYMTDAGDFPPVRECYMVGRVFFFPALKDVRPVSHWMPFPEPPKMKGGAE